MPVDTFQLKSVVIKCLQGCWGPRHEKINGVSNSKITHCAILISVLVMIARKYKYWFWYCIRNNLAVSKYSISNPNQRLSHNSTCQPSVDIWCLLCPSTVQILIDNLTVLGLEIPKEGFKMGFNRDQRLGWNSSSRFELKTIRAFRACSSSLDILDCNKRDDDQFWLKC